MKFSICFTSPLLVGALNAQPTITNVHLPAVGDVFITHRDTAAAPGWYPTAGGGTAQTWDFTASYNVDLVDTFSYVSPTGLPGAASFPNSTHAHQQPSAPLEVSQFYSIGADGFMVDGFSSEMPGVFTNTVIYTGWYLFPTPATYGDNETSSLSWDGITVFDPLLMLPAGRTIAHWSQWYQADAFGTVHTPAYPNGVEVLRLKTGYGGTRTDSTYLDASGTGNGPWVLDEVDVMSTASENYTVFFLQAAEPMVVATLICDAFTNEVKSASYADNDVGSGFAPLSALPAMQLYPMPATSGTVWVQLPADRTAQLLVRDVTGRPVLRQTVSGTARAAIAVDGWPAGTYTVEALSVEGRRLAQGRLMIAQ